MKKLIAIASAAALLLSATPALAYGRHHSSSDVEVSNNNGAIVINHVESEANTGDNYAGGAEGGNGGNAGDIDADGEVEDSSTGNGGNGGAAGDNSGGIITTGDAESEAGVLNVVNSNATRVNADCGCSGDVTVRNRNHAFVANNVESEAETGDNTAKGAEGGNGGNGGDIDADDDEVDNSDTGNGGAGGASGEGGDILTGHATSRTGVVNIVNTNLTRVRR